MNIPEYFKNMRFRRGNLGSIEQDEYQNIIIGLLYSANGQEKRNIIISKILDILSKQFSDADYQLLKSQKPPKERWTHNVDWAKRKLVLQGILLNPEQSPYGTWVLSDEGRKRAAELSKNIA